MIRSWCCLAGAGPEEVEKGALLKIEESLTAIQRDRRVEDDRARGYGRWVYVSVDQTYELSEVTDR